MRKEQFAYLAEKIASFITGSLTFFPLQPGTFLATRKRCPACLTFSPAGKFPAAEKHAALSTTRVLAEIYGRWCQDRAKIFTFRGRQLTYRQDIRTLCRQKLADRETTWKRSAPIVAIVRDRAFRLFPIHRLEFLF